MSSSARYTRSDYEVRPPQQPPADALEAILDAADGLAALPGPAVKEPPELASARTVLARSRDLVRRAAEIRTADPAAGIRQAAADYAAGDLELGALVQRAADLTRGTDPNDPIHRTLTAAAGTVNAIGARQLFAVGDRWITDLVRPKLAGLLGPAIAAAAAIPEGVVDPADYVIEADRGLRRAWEDLEDAVRGIDELHRMADGLRSNGAIPLPRVADRSRGLYWRTQQLRWLHHDRMVEYYGRPAPHFLQCHRNGAEHGIWTHTELAEANEYLTGAAQQVA